MLCDVQCGTEGQLCYFFLRQSLNRIYLTFILLAEPLNDKGGGGNRSTRRKPLATSFRKCHILQSEDLSPKLTLWALGKFKGSGSGIKNDDDNNEHTERHNSRSLQSPQCTANCRQHVRLSCKSWVWIMWNTSGAHHMQHVVCILVVSDRLSLTEFKLHLFQCSFIGWNH